VTDGPLYPFPMRATDAFLELDAVAPPSPGFMGEARRFLRAWCEGAPCHMPAPTDFDEAWAAAELDRERERIRAEEYEPVFTAEQLSDPELVEEQLRLAVAYGVFLIPLGAAAERGDVRALRALGLAGLSRAWCDPDVANDNVAALVELLVALACAWALDRAEELARARARVVRVASPAHGPPRRTCRAIGVQQHAPPAAATRAHSAACRYGTHLGAHHAAPPTTRAHTTVCRCERLRLTARLSP